MNEKKQKFLDSVKELTGLSFIPKCRYIFSFEIQVDEKGNVCISNESLINNTPVQYINLPRSFTAMGEKG